jgi:hypothetical protein
MNVSHPRRNHVSHEKAAPSLLTIIQEAVDRLVFSSVKHTVHEVSFRPFGSACTGELRWLHTTKGRDTPLVPTRIIRYPFFT